MLDIMEKEVSTVELKDLVQKFVAESISKEIEKQCASVYPLHDVFIRKVKILKKPKFDSTSSLSCWWVMCRGRCLDEQRRGD